MMSRNNTITTYLRGTKALLYENQLQKVLNNKKKLKVKLHSTVYKLKKIAFQHYTLI